MNATGLTKPLTFLACVVFATCAAVSVLKWTESPPSDTAEIQATGEISKRSATETLVGTGPYGPTGPNRAGGDKDRPDRARYGSASAAEKLRSSRGDPDQVRPVQYVEQGDSPEQLRQGTGRTRQGTGRIADHPETADDRPSNPANERDGPPLRFVPRNQAEAHGQPASDGIAPPGITTRDLFRALRGPFEPFGPQLRDPALPQYRIPFSSELPTDAVRTDRETGRVTIIVRDAPLSDILNVLAQQQGLDLITGEDIVARLNLTLEQVPLETALNQMLSVAGYTWVRQGDVLIVTSMANGRALSPQAQGRALRVFGLDYAAAMDLDIVVKGLLSPVGQSFVMQASDADQRRTQEMLVVEDLPEYLARIADYVRAVDVPPRQVLIEAHVLAVELKDDLEFGVNLQYLAENGHSVTLRTQGFANAAKYALGAGPAFFANIETGDLTALIEALEETKDAKTLARPKVLTLNGQKARIQVGQQLGYRVTTTTQTSTLESVEFLDTGVVLEVTPVVTRDGNIVMHVKPEISTGEINASTELPEEDTTEVQTSLMLPNGHGMVIGGLIQEEDIENQMKIPILGDLWLVGRLFQRREITRRRDEIIIALVPHIMPYGPERHQQECHDYHRATTPLLYGPLNQNPRPDEPRFPDAGQFGTLPENIHRFHPPTDHRGWCPEGSTEACLPEGLPYPPPAHGLPEPPQPVPPRRPGGPLLQPTGPRLQPGGPLLQPTGPNLSPLEEVPAPREPVPAPTPSWPPPAPAAESGAAAPADGVRRNSPWRPTEPESTAVEAARHQLPRPSVPRVTMASGLQPATVASGPRNAPANREPDGSSRADEDSCRRLPYCREYPR